MVKSGLLERIKGKNEEKCNGNINKEYTRQAFIGCT